MAKPIIAIDLDDVLSDSTESLRQVVNTQYGVSLEPEHYRIPGEYSRYYERVWEMHGIGNTVSYADLEGQMISDQSHMPVKFGAVRVLKQLQKHHDLVVLTARNPDWEVATSAWLNIHFPGIFRRVVFGGGRKSVIAKSKGEWCADIGASWLIDDNPEHCQTAVKHGITPILFGEYGWHLRVPMEFQRCRNWEELSEYFEEH
ncbi:MAG TPA: hypothetical protein VF575_05735 [Candidatus Saccharimonadales bacterium]|jgi:5'(3')-deoxyribonucleotidase